MPQDWSLQGVRQCASPVVNLFPLLQEADSFLSEAVTKDLLSSLGGLTTTRLKNSRASGKLQRAYPALPSPPPQAESGSHSRLHSSFLEEAWPRLSQSRQSAEIMSSKHREKSLDLNTLAPASRESWLPDSPFPPVLPPKTLIALLAYL